MHNELFSAISLCKLLFEMMMMMMMMTMFAFD